MNHEPTTDPTQLPTPSPLCDEGVVERLLDQADLTLPRLVWLVEQRGFRIARLDMTRVEAGFRFRIEVRARAPHYRLDVLDRQIDRLVGVRRLAVAKREQAA
jgi:acetolactate synthase regulatory subunit